MAEDDTMTETEQLKAELEALRSEVASLKREEKLLPDATAALAKYDLNDNEKRVLELIALGLNQTEASLAASRHEDYVKNRLYASKAFANAYRDIQGEFANWQEARLRFVLPEVWREIDVLLKVDPEDYVEEGNWRYAQTLWNAKARIIDKLLRLNYAQESKIVHQHEVDIPMLQMAQENLGLIAEHLQKLSLEDTQGVLEDRLPENQAIDLTPLEYNLQFDHQPRRDDGKARCLECGSWVLHLGRHLQEKHNMSTRAYKAKNNLDPLEGIDVESVTVDVDDTA